MDTATIEGATLEQLQARAAELAGLLENPAADELEALVTEAEAVGQRITALRQSEARLREARAALLSAGTSQPPNADRPPAVQVREAAPFDMADVAERFINSEGFANFRANGLKGKYALDLRDTRMGEILGLEQRAPLDNTPTSAGAFQNPARPAVVPMANADRRLRVADLIDRQTTGDNTVEYVRDTTGVGAGDTAREVAEGAAKPEAGFTFEVVTDSVRTVAHWVQITRQAADDNQQLMGYIRGRLRYGLEYRLDAQIINGNGTAPNLRGILNTTGINTVAPGVAEARIITIRKGITEAEVDEYSPTGVVLHPRDWEKVELSTDNDGMFRVSPNVANALAPRIWGLNVVSTTAIAEGTGLVGDFRAGATLWDRMQPQIFMTDSHSSTFTSNILTLLAELRVALSVWRPPAFTRCTFNGTI